MRIASVVSCVIFLILYSVTSLFCSKAVFLSLKFLASISFFLIAYFSRKRVLNSGKQITDSYRKYSFLFLLAMFFSVIGDTLIELFFIPGFAAFLVTQIIFLTAFLKNRKPSARFIITPLIGTVLLALFEKFQPFISIGSLYIPLMIYVAVILVNVSLSSQYLQKKSVYAKLLFAGMFLFFLSDFELQYSVFGDHNSSLHTFFALLNNFIYYPAQILLALSLGEDFIS